MSCFGVLIPVQLYSLPLLSSPFSTSKGGCSYEPGP